MPVATSMDAIAHIPLVSFTAEITLPNLMNRRTFLRGTGVALALPVQDAMGAVKAGKVKRMVVFSNAFGMYPDAFFPKEAGANYRMPELLQPLERHRKQLTVFSNLDHGLNLGHAGSATFLNGIEAQDAAHFPDGNISMDQRAAEWMKAATRFPSLQTSVRGGKHRMSWTRNAVNLHAIGCRSLFDQLFLDLDAKGRAKQGERFEQENSILDVVRDQARSVHLRLGRNDQDKLEEYLTAIRGLEKRFAQEAQWLHRDKPRTQLAAPDQKVADTATEHEMHMELLALALQTDSTRIITTEFGTQNGDHDLPLSYHAYSHHGERPELVQGLMAIEKFQMGHIARFLDRLKRTEDPLNGGNLLDHTMVLFGCGMSTGHHSNKNLPLFLAGGGFKHGEHKVFPADKSDRTPACNLLLTLLQQFGLEIDQFGTSTGTLSLT
tara:strand:+ start:11833 stop:13140 length:1308 start_codon:yes stop_codon:yes gene_type:complete